MKPLFPLLLLAYAGLASATPFPEGNADLGKKLFDQNRCNRCHIAMVGGDGSGIFTRPDHKVRTPEQMVEQMHVCSANVGITLSHADEQNLGAYLNRYYKLK